MNKKRVTLYLGGILAMAVAMAVPFHRYSEAKTRSMASVAQAIPYFEQQAQEPTVPQKVKEELSVNCDVKEPVVKSVSESSQVVRITFVDCQHISKKAPLFFIKNKSNGYDGQIFAGHMKKAKGRSPASAGMQLSTDYIQLQKGENIIELQISLNDGQKINKKITINRQ